MSAFIRVNATAAPGLEPMRRYDAHHSRNAGSAALEGARTSIPTGPPHSSTIESQNASRSSRVVPHG